MSALGLALVVALLALTRFEDGETVAMIFGAVAFGAVMASRERATQAIATIIAALMCELHRLAGSEPLPGFEPCGMTGAIVVAERSDPIGPDLDPAGRRRQGIPDRVPPELLEQGRLLFRLGKEQRPSVWAKPSIGPYDHTTRPGHAC